MPLAMLFTHDVLCSDFFVFVGLGFGGIFMSSPKN